MAHIWRSRGRTGFRVEVRTTHMAPCLMWLATIHRDSSQYMNYCPSFNGQGGRQQWMVRTVADNISHPQSCR